MLLARDSTASTPLRQPWAIRQHHIQASNVLLCQSCRLVRLGLLNSTHSTRAPQLTRTRMVRRLLRAMTPSLAHMVRPRTIAHMVRVPLFLHLSLPIAFCQCSHPPKNLPALRPLGLEGAVFCPPSALRDGETKNACACLALVDVLRRLPAKPHTACSRGLATRYY